MYFVIGNPDQISFGEDCTELWPNQGWNDATCDWEKNVICQVKEGNKIHLFLINESNIIMVTCKFTNYTDFKGVQYPKV